MRTATAIGLVLIAVAIGIMVVLPDDDDRNTTTTTEPSPITPTSTKEPPRPAPPQLTVLSSPAGATVEVGIKAVDGAITPGTGRVVGVTPLTNVELTDADVSYGPTFTNLYVEVRLDGYAPYLQIFGLGESGLEPGETYEIDVTLSVP